VFSPEVYTSSFRGDVRPSVPGILHGLNRLSLAFSRPLLTTIVVNPSGVTNNKTKTKEGRQSGKQFPLLCAESEVLILSRQITFIHYCYCVVISTDNHCCFTYRLSILRSVSASWLDMVPAKTVHVTNSCLWHVFECAAKWTQLFT